MTMHDDIRGRETGERVAVSPGVPTDRVRWAPIWAGVFAALTAFALLSTLGVAIGLSSYDPGDDARRFAIGAGIWGLLSMLLAFGFGGWITGRSSAVRGHDNGLLNGFMVAAVGIPLMLFALGSATNAAADNAISRSTTNTRTGLDNAMTASDRITSDGASASQADANVSDDDARRAARRTAWGTLLALALAIGAAAAAGYVGAGDRRGDRDDRYAGAVGRRSDS